MCFRPIWHIFLSCIFAQKLSFSIIFIWCFKVFVVVETFDVVHKVCTKSLSVQNTFGMYFGDYTRIFGQQLYTVECPMNIQAHEISVKNV